jgi:hypothetical protein
MDARDDPFGFGAVRFNDGGVDNEDDNDDEVDIMIVARATADKGDIDKAITLLRGAMAQLADRTSVPALMFVYEIRALLTEAPVVDHAAVEAVNAEIVAFRAGLDQTVLEEQERVCAALMVSGDALVELGNYDEALSVKVFMNLIDCELELNSFKLGVRGCKRTP